MRCTPYLKVITNNLMLKVVSLMIGTACWLHYSYQQPVRLHRDLPVSFYNTDPDQVIQAPEQIHVELMAKRADLYRLDLDHLALHIDACKLHEGKQPLTIGHKQLFLPPSVKLVNYMTSNSYVHVS